MQYITEFKNIRVTFKNLNKQTIRLLFNIWNQQLYKK